MELTAKIRAALDEDERAALYASQDNGTGIWDEVVSGTLRLDGVEGLDGLIPIGDLRLTRHIARHDPARVLRQVAAMRKILDEHEIEEPGESYQYCRSCQDHERHDAHSAPCPTLLALAEAYGIEP